MSPNLLTLPGELRNEIFKQVLVVQGPIEPGPYCFQPPSLTRELLRVNKAIHREAISLLYTQNCFDFTEYDSEDLISFLDNIGRNNASRIQQVYINFPKIRDLGADPLIMDEDYVRYFAKIQSDCTDLRTITTSARSTNAMVLKLDKLDKPHVVGEVLALVDTHFKAITSLKQIIVEVYEDGPSAALRKVMESRGWTIKVVGRAEESDFAGSFSDSDDEPDFDDETLQDLHCLDYEDGYEYVASDISGD